MLAGSWYTLQHALQVADVLCTLCCLNMGFALALGFPSLGGPTLSSQGCQTHYKCYNLAHVLLAKSAAQVYPFGSSRVLWQTAQDLGKYS